MAETSLWSWLCFCRQSHADNNAGRPTPPFLRASLLARRQSRNRTVLQFLYGVLALLCVGAPLYMAVLTTYEVWVGSNFMTSTTASPFSATAARDRVMTHQIIGSLPQPKQQTPTLGAPQSSSAVLDQKCRRSWAERAPVGQKADKIRAVEHLIPVRYTKDEPAFLWAVIPNRRMISWLGNHETHVRIFANRVLQQACSSNSNQIPAMVLDVGANSGYYGLMALAHGCRALFVEPQPYCGMLIETSLVANGWNRRNGSLAQIWPVAAGHEYRNEGLRVWCDTPCYGTVGAPGVGEPTQAMKGDPHPRSDLNGWRPMAPLADHPWLRGRHARQEIALLKVDVEGAEASVLQGLRPVFEQRMVQAATIEISPQFYWQRKQHAQLRKAICDEILFVWNHGYGIWAPIGMDEQRKDGRGNRYQRLRTESQIKYYLIEHPFTQHDLFLHRRNRGIDWTDDDADLAWIANDLFVRPM